ncbi:MAG: PAS domain-containing protein, partial [Proteobacteria bacterium]|nr:PAS domain-containing protein [Pseudomonadota bacterium]
MNSESGKEIATLMHNAANRIAVAQNQIRKIKTALPLNRTTAESKKDIESWLEILNAEMDQLAEIQRAVNTSLLKSADHPDARFEEHYNRSIDLICVAGTDACFKHVNPAFHRLLGYTNDELLSKPFLDFIHPDDLPGTLAEVAKLAEGAKTLHFENRYRTKAGDFKTLSWVSEIDLKTGNIYAIARDVTALRTSEERFRQLISTLNKTAIVAFTDAKGVILEINDGFCKISGYSPEELIGNDHRLINSGAHSKTFFENMWETIAAGTIWVGDIQNRRKDGGFYWVRTTICPLLNNYGVLESYVAIKFDITQQKIAEQLGQELREQLEASLEISQNAERGFRVIFENSPIGILQTDARLLLKFVNAAFLKFIGWPEQDMSIVSLLHFCHADDSPKLLQYIAQANQDGKAPDAPPLTLRFNHKSGNAVTGRLTARKIPLQGEEPYLLLVIEDITDAQLQETALLKAK